ncbi:unnamed protein product [Amaranthus hypochondriacus]
MASNHLFKVRAIMVVAMVMAAVVNMVMVTGQETGSGLSPLPAAEAGNGFLLPISGTLLVSSVLMCLIAVF